MKHVLLCFGQARAHTLLRQKEAELSKARESAAKQFQADVAAAEASTQRVQQLLEQVCLKQSHVLVNNVT